jgi:hypothetical protein
MSIHLIFKRELWVKGLVATAIVALVIHWMADPVIAWPSRQRVPRELSSPGAPSPKFWRQAGNRLELGMEIERAHAD